MERLTGAQALVRSLREEGVEVIFGYPGGSVLPFYDELYDSDIRHILVRHEQGAAHAADGYARATGRVGVCAATSGPGATNLVTGIATAYMDSIPIVAITGQVKTFLIGNDAFQEANITGITMPITKHNYLITHVEDLPIYVKEAFHLASTGRNGPVLIDIPVDILNMELDFEYPQDVAIPGYKLTVAGHTLQIKKAAEFIMNSERPVIIAGGGIIASEASEELKELVELINTPVTVTLMGTGCFPTEHPLSLGMPGMHGTKYANYAISEADLLIAVGMRFDDRVTGRLDEFAKTAHIIHIDVDPAEISKNVRIDVPIVGDAKQVLGELVATLRKEGVSKMPDREWNQRIQGWKKEHPLHYVQTDVIKPQYVVEQIWEACPDAIITTEVGQNQMWAAQYFRYTKPRTFISSGGLGTMGYGLPAAIGAQAACPDKIVFDIAGDGSFMMKCQELATAVEHDIPVNVAILNNQYLGMVRQWQELFFDRRYSNTSLESRTDFVKLAEAFGAVGIRVVKPEEVRPAIEKAIDTDAPVVIDFRIEREENVSPMVAAGAPIYEMLELEIKGSETKEMDSKKEIIPAPAT